MSSPAPIFSGERAKKLFLSYSSGSPFVFKTFQNPGKRIRSVEISIEQAFNAAAILSVGTAGDHDFLFSGTDNDPRTVSTYVVPNDYVITGGEQFYVFITLNGSTQGTFYVILKYI